MKIYLLALLAGLIGGLLGISLFVPHAGNQKETAYQRVMRTNTLRCGYNDWAPFFKKDGAHGQPEGFLVDLMTAITQHANMKLEWTAFVDWGTAPNDLASGKVDSFCAAIYANAARARGMLFGEVIGYQALEPFVRADDNRFTGTPDQAFNRPDVTVVGWEATPSLMEAQERFPQAKFLAVSPNAATSTGYLDVITHKADVFFSSMADASGFMQSNPGKIKPLDQRYNLGSQAIAVNAPAGNEDLLNFLDNALRELKNDGTYDRLVQKYQHQVPGFMTPANNR